MISSILEASLQAQETHAALLADASRGRSTAAAASPSVPSGGGVAY